MRFAYADPPYPGKARLYPEKTEVDHAALFEQLVREYPDGWALSTASTTLRGLLALPECPTDIRIMAWVKRWTSFKKGVRVAYAWEPVLVRGGRPRSEAQGTVYDWVVAQMVPHHRSSEPPFPGKKPDRFYHWLREVLNVQPGDTLDDLYPGTRGLERIMRQGVLPTARGREPREEAGHE